MVAILGLLLTFKNINPASFPQKREIIKNNDWFNVIKFKESSPQN